MHNQIKTDLTRTPLVKQATNRLYDLHNEYSKSEVETAFFMVLLGRDSKNETLTIHLDNLVLSYDCDILLDAANIMNYAEQLKNVI